MRKKVCILYDKDSMHVFTIKNYLSMFRRYSHHEVTYLPATGKARCRKKDLDLFDVVIIFYSIRICTEGHLSVTFEKALRHYCGHKILMIQDDYDHTEQTRRMITYLDIHTVFTVVPQEYIYTVYPKERFRGVKFHNILTGYISDEMKNYRSKPPISKRPVLIGYRGRDIGYWYGNLAHEKLEIGVKMKEICRKRGLHVDIEWEEGRRIYYEQWLAWLSSCKAILGTESGSNIFDEKEQLKKKVLRAQKRNPDITYEKIYDRYLKQYEGKIKRNSIMMNQISPKIFEAISLKTALILFEGEYSGILKKDVHYISLKKDFSNVEEVLRKVQDDEFLQNMVDTVYRDIMDREELSYRWLIRYMDECIDSESAWIGRKKKFCVADLLFWVEKKYQWLLRGVKFIVRKMRARK